MEEAADLSAAVLALQVDLLQLPPEIPAPGAPALRGILDRLFAHWLLPDTVALVNYLVQKAKASGGGGPGIAGAAMLPSMMLQGGASVPPLSPRSPRLARRPSGVGAGQPNRSASQLRSAAAHPAKEVISQVQTFPQSIFAPRMFYFFFESRGHKENPVVIWLTGGPGCSSELALFYENGPFHIADNMSLVWNDFGWDQESNLIYVDQPTGTGFSYSSYSGDTRHNEANVSNDLYDFLQAFFTEHPKYAKNDFYITGESYAGHYIPALSSRVHQGNKNNEGIHINLKGFAIGNGLTDPAIQYKAYTDYALDMGLITQSQFNRINKIVPTCEFAIKLCGTSGTVSCLAAYFVCNVIFGSIRIIIGSKNVGKPCVGSLCYDFSNMEKFLNLKSVRESLGVGDIEFVSCSPTVYEAMLLDWMRNLEVGIPELLENDIKVLIYAGEYDLICNWLGVSYYKEKVGRKEVHKLKLPVLPSDHFGLVLTITHQDENF